MASSMDGKVALITGGAQGIGRAICDQFAQAGATVGILDIKADNAERAAQAIRDRGGKAVACGGNVAERATFEMAVSLMEREFGRLDVLVNNAIWVRYSPIDAITPQMLERMVGTGFNSVVWGTQVAAPLMEKGGGGSIVNIASAAGYLGIPNAAIYCGVKAGVLGLTRACAVELGPRGIRVNAIAPGTIMTEGVSINVDEAGMAKRIARTPVGRLGQVEDIAKAALFLAGGDSGFISGEALLVDGGVTHAFL